MDIDTKQEIKEWLQDYYNFGGIKTPLESRAKEILNSIIKNDSE